MALPFAPMLYGEVAAGLAPDQMAPFAFDQARRVADRLPCAILEMMLMPLRALIALILFALAIPALAQPNGKVLPDMLAMVDDGGVAAAFYQQRAGALAWSGSPRAAEDARLALDVLSRAGTQGLNADRYGVYHSGDPVADDVAISVAVLTYMRDVAIGRPALEAMDADVALRPREFDAATILNTALRDGRLVAVLENLGPPHAEYRALKAALARQLTTGDAAVVAANMERWRWMPAQLEPDRIVINAAKAELELWLGGKVALTSRVIVGRPGNPTPILRAEGAGVTINPPWTVPHSIAVKEILPKLKSNPGYLAKEDMVLLNGPPGDPHGLHVNWRSIRAGTFPYRIRQVPGPHNALGRIKLELPNQFDVYLHDTPARTLFAKPKRALSHGCVRVEQIMPLASYTLAGDLSAMDRITQSIAGGQTEYLPLKRTLPVYFLYWTAFSGPSGAMEMAADIYGRDRRLISAMQSQPLRIASAAANCSRG
jgi:murein L,D-transpeptidase YcbB/YkuD